MSAEQYGVYLSNYKVYLEAISARKGEVKAILRDKDDKKKTAKVLAQPAVEKSVPGPSVKKAQKTAKNRRKRASRKMRKLEKKAVEAQLVMPVIKAELASKQLGKKAPPKIRVVKVDQTAESGRRTLPKKRYPGRNRAARRAHLHEAAKSLQRSGVVRRPGEKKPYLGKVSHAARVIVGL